MEANQLPTKVGPYYWRESEGDEFQLVRVELHLYNRNPDVVHLSCYSGKEMRMLPIKDMQGQWLPIPTAEELVELQAKAKAYDEGKTIYAIFDRKGQVISECSSALGPSLAWDRFIRVYFLSQESGIEHGYTCRKVRVCKEVES